MSTENHWMKYNKQHLKKNITILVTYRRAYRLLE